MSDPVLKVQLKICCFEPLLVLVDIGQGFISAYLWRAKVEVGFGCKKFNCDGGLRKPYLTLQGVLEYTSLLCHNRTKELHNYTPWVHVWDMG